MSLNYLAPERFRVKWRNARRYVDREPACPIAEPTAEKELLPNCTSIAKEVGSEAFFKKVGASRVPLDALRVADGVNANWDRLAELPPDERRETMANYAPRDLARAAERGTAVHALIEGLLRGEAPLFLDGEADQYRDIAEKVAADYADRLTHMEIVGFNRGDHPYGGTYDGLNADTGLILDWKTRGPDSQHGCYEKEVAQLGLAILCDYWFDLAPDGTPQRRLFPPVTELEVVSIRPDSYEVYPVDPLHAVTVAQRAIEIHAAKSDAGKNARKAVGDPRPMPATPAVDQGKPPRIEPLPAAPKPTTPDEGPLLDVEAATAKLTAGFKALGVTPELMKVWNRWVKEGRFRFSELPSTRRLELYKAGARLVVIVGENDEDDEERQRDALQIIHAALGKEVTGTVGKALGSFTIEQARRLANVCDQITAGAAITYGDDGTPQVAA